GSSCIAFFSRAEAGIRDGHVTGVQTCALPIYPVLTRVFGRKIEVARNIDLVIIFVVGVSVLPIAYKAFKHWRAKRLAKGISTPAIGRASGRERVVRGVRSVS